MLDLIKTAQAKDKLIKAGFTPTAAAITLGNFGWESGGLKGDAVNPKSKAIGWAQWLGPRKNDLIKYAESKGKPITDDNTQLEYFLKEVRDGKHVPKNLIEKLNLYGPDRLAEGTKYFENAVERSGKNEKHYEDRTKLAQQALDVQPETTLPTVEVTAPAATPDTYSSESKVANTGTMPLDTSVPKDEMPKPMEKLKAKDLLNSDTWKNMSLQQMLEIKNQFHKTAGYGDMGHFKAGLESGANPEYAQQYAPVGMGAQDSLLGLIKMAGGGQQQQQSAPQQAQQLQTPTWNAPWQSAQNQDQQLTPLQQLIASGKHADYWRS